MMDAQVQITNMGTHSQTNAETQEQPSSCLVNMKAAPPMHVRDTHNTCTSASIHLPNRKQT